LRFHVLHPPLSASAAAKEIKHSGLEDLVSNSKHVVAIGNIQRFGVWHQFCELRRRTGDVVAGADTDQSGCLHPG
jgi:hypothetical protein